MTNSKDGSTPLPSRSVADRSVRRAAQDAVRRPASRVEIIHQPAAHTDGDLMVFFRKSDVISAGDIFSTDRLSRD